MVAHRCLFVESIWPRNTVHERYIVSSGCHTYTITLVSLCNARPMLTNVRHIFGMFLITVLVGFSMVTRMGLACTISQPLCTTDLSYDVLLMTSPDVKEEAMSDTAATRGFHATRVSSTLRTKVERLPTSSQLRDWACEQCSSNIMFLSSGALTRVTTRNEIFACFAAPPHVIGPCAQSAFRAC